MFKHIIAVHTQNPPVKNAESITFKVGGTYRYHLALKGQTGVEMVKQFCVTI
jgi:hypothetical protein